jgi:RNA polymerase sigma-70 factor, ECF subfamily
VTIEEFGDRIRRALGRLAGAGDAEPTPGSPLHVVAPAGQDRHVVVPARPPDEPPLHKPGFVEEALPWLPAVHRYALRLTRGNEAEAGDLVQETFLRAYRAWDQFQRGTNCRAWLFTICHNTHLHGEGRAARRKERVVSQLDADIESLAMSAAFRELSAIDPEGEFFDNLLDEDVVRAIDALPEDYREVLVLSDLGGLTYDEIASVLEIPLGTVKSRLFRARRRLQESLFDYAVEMGYIGAGDKP